MRRLVGLSILAATAISTGWFAPAPARQAAHQAQAVAKQAGTRLILLGTAGGPGAMVERAGIASLLVVEGKPYLIDAGEGMARQLVRAGFDERDVDTVFLTHLHDDHTSGLPALASFRYTIPPRPGSVPTPLEVIGPPGTARLVDGLLAFMDVNAEIRMAERPRLPKPAATIRARELGAADVFDDGRVKVTSMENTHYHLPPQWAARDKSYSYRFETKDKTVVFTGDTGPSDRLVDFARGADVLVAEMITPADIKSVPAPIVEHLLTEHLTAADLGKLATQARVKTLVLSHVRTLAPSDVADIRKVYSGRIVAGQDLLEL